MRKLLGLLHAIALAVPAWSQNQPTPSPSPTAQANQAATKEPEALTRAKSYVENTSEAKSIEKTKQSVTFDLVKSETFLQAV